MKTSESPSPAQPLAEVLRDGPTYRIGGAGPAADYAAALLGSLGGRVERAPGEHSPHPDVEWARSGAMALTGAASGPPLLAPGPLASCARGAAEACALLAGERWRAPLDGPALLGERAAIFGLSRRGTTSPGGSCRLVRAADRWFAVNLARPDDRSLLPAWLGEGPLDDPWRFVEARAARQPAAAVVERARLLGLPAAVAADPSPVAPPWCRLAARGTRSKRSKSGVPLVIDLSSLWAGPLCCHLLGLAGARVVKVESSRRPDAARSGPPAFFDLLNHAKASVVLDFGTDAGRAQLRQLLQRADIVVESARPRALAQLGIDAGELVASLPGLTWVSITGYGRSQPGAGWVAFGDDAAVAAGLAVATGRAAATAGGGGQPLFCGDAIADPLAGLHAAVSALAAWHGGGGQLLDLALRDVTAHALAFDAPAAEASVRRSENAGDRGADAGDRGADAGDRGADAGDAWEVVAGRERASVAAARARVPVAAARPLGADTAAVLAELDVPC